ncbi:MAG: DUF1697 domain-containing protein [Paludibacter sp.]|nr:DUF1697 domain-containing protein [Paludibacter sp.]
MTTYISILRGINVGGHNQIKMDTLRQLYVELGYADVKTYIQSGNVIFRDDSTDPKVLEKSIADKIMNTLGLKVQVLVLTIEDLKNALDNNPYTKDPSRDIAFMHLTFLSDIPDSALVQKIPADEFTPDEFHCSGKTIYLYMPDGYGNTKLNNTFFEKKLKVTATTRNLRTSLEIMRLAEEIKFKD